MQPHQYVLAMGILWLTSFLILPFLFGRTRRRAREEGREAGLAERDGIYALQTQALIANLANTTQELDTERAEAKRVAAAYQQTIAELEARIMSYTGLAVTREDYELLLGTAETLRLTERTLKALKAQQQATAAAARAEGIDGLAKRIHAQLRDTPSAGRDAGKAA